MSEKKKIEFELQAISEGNQVQIISPNLEDRALDVVILGAVRHKDGAIIVAACVPMPSFLMKAAVEEAERVLGGDS